MSLLGSGKRNRAHAKGAYSPRWCSRNLLETPFSEPLLRTLPQNPSQNLLRTLLRTLCCTYKPLGVHPKEVKQNCGFRGKTSHVHGATGRSSEDAMGGEGRKPYEGHLCQEGVLKPLRWYVCHRCQVWLFGSSCIKFQD